MSSFSNATGNDLPHTADLPTRLLSVREIALSFGFQWFGRNERGVATAIDPTRNAILKVSARGWWLVGADVSGRTAGELEAALTQHGWQGWREAQAADDFYSNKRHNLLLGQLKALPYASEIRVFGSLAHGKAMPGDIDVALDLRGRDWTRHAAARDLLYLSRLFFYGLDPFLHTDGGMLCQSANGGTWVRARHASGLVRAITKNSRALTSLSPLSESR